MLEVLFLLATAWASSVPTDIPNPRKEDRWISDSAGVISPEAEVRMNAKLDALAQELQVEVAVVTVAGVAGTPKEFTTELFNLWGVGSKETNSGLLVVLAMDQRRLEMETGYGLEARLPDGWLGTMQAQKMVPFFKRGEHGAGLEAGIAAVDARLRRGGPVTEGADGSSFQDASGTEGAVGLLGMCCAIAGLFVCVLLAFWYIRYRQRTCEKCKGEMVLLSEVEDDAHLGEGQKTEERIGAVDWLVRVCSSCGHIRIRSKVKTGFAICTECSNRTGARQFTTVEPATYSSPGAGRLTVECQHCGHKNSSTYVISKLVETTHSDDDWTTYGDSSSSDDYGGGSDFGGGSSGGGGAGSSW